MATLRCFSRRLKGMKSNIELNATLSFAFNRCISNVSKEYCQERDPAPLFFCKEVQILLKSLTRVDLNKVFSKRKLEEKRLEIPKYKFLTEDQLQEAVENARRKSENMLQIPPIVKVRIPVNKVLSKDPSLQGLDIAKFVFTDITFGIKSCDRIIVVRLPNGTLQEADWILRDRMNQVYFPVASRKLKIPLMFQEPYFKNLLSRNKYEFILDRACIQFEPDDPEYQRVTSITYQQVNNDNAFELLRSTRHFGSLVFFLIWFKIIDNLMLELIQTSHIDEANVLLQLFGKIHNLTFNLKHVENIEQYVKEFATKCASLELALQTYKDLEKQRSELEHGIQEAHGSSY